MTDMECSVCVFVGFTDTRRCTLRTDFGHALRATQIAEVTCGPTCGLFWLKLYKFTIKNEKSNFASFWFLLILFTELKAKLRGPGGGLGWGLLELGNLWENAGNCV